MSSVKPATWFSVVGGSPPGWVVTATTAFGETLASPETFATVGANATVNLAWYAVPFATGYKSYIRDATLTLRDENGTVLSSSAYALDGAFQMGKWSSSRSKLAPVVTALVTGFDH